jgi:hypothetical protein
MDPITIIATASAAYNALKKGIAVGRELQDMGSQLATWAGAVSDLEFISKRAEDPPWWRSIGGSAQAEAVEIFAAKRKVEQQRAELKQFIQFAYGQSAWEELLRIEGQVRKQRAATAHKQAEMKELGITILVAILCVLAGVAGLALLAFVLWSMQEAS